MYTKFISKFKETKCCPLCVRGFENEDGSEAFLKKLENVLARVPNATKSAEADFAKAEKAVKELEKLASVWDDCIRLKNIEITELEQKLKIFEEEKLAISGNTEDVINY
jgi:DNA repair protein RAD50